MCYSAKVVQDYKRYRREYGAKLSIKEFFELFYKRKSGDRVVIAKGMEDALAASTEAELSDIRAMLEEHAAGEAARLEQEVFAQRARLVEADRKLQAKVTKGATESKRIAGDKIERALSKLADLRRREPKDRDSRIYPGTYALVMAMDEGERVILPMRYQCRPVGKPSFYDTKYPGTYNARRDNLGGFWRELWGHSHGIVIATAFYENVNRHRAEGRELSPGEEVENLILEFRPQPEQEMLVACLWSRWTAPGEPDLLSFAAITDEPPVEVAAAGHDRCIIPVKPENVDAWLNPDPRKLDELQAILDDRARPYYEHRLAA